MPIQTPKPVWYWHINDMLKIKLYKTKKKDINLKDKVENYSASSHH